MAGKKIISNNKKARHEFSIEQTYEAGIVLTGTEIKSIRQGNVNIKESYVKIENGEAFIYGMHINPYEQGNIFNVEPLRPRKLLLHKREISKMVGYIKQKGFTIVPLRLYIDHSGRAKLEIATAKGKNLYDKRKDLAKRDAERKMDQARKMR